MGRKRKVRACRDCGKVGVPLSRRGLCYECAARRVQKWIEFMKESAKEVMATKKRVNCVCQQTCVLKLGSLSLKVLKKSLVSC